MGTCSVQWATTMLYTHTPVLTVLFTRSTEFFLSTRQAWVWSMISSLYCFKDSGNLSHLSDMESQTVSYILLWMDLALSGRSAKKCLACVHTHTRTHAHTWPLTTSTHCTWTQWVVNSWLTTHVRTRLFCTLYTFVCVCVCMQMLQLVKYVT